MKQHIGGFTLLEMLASMAILMTVCVLGIPSYQHLVAKNKADRAIMRLYRAIQLARSVAIKHQCLVTICGTQDYKTCSSDWGQGYMVFVDRQGDGKLISKNQLIKVFRATSVGDRLSWRGFPNKQYLQVTPLGFTNSQNGTFRYCPKTNNPQFARALFVSQSGRLRFSEDVNRDGVQEDSGGNALKCLSQFKA